MQDASAVTGAGEQGGGPWSAARWMRSNGQGGGVMPKPYKTRGSLGNADKSLVSYGFAVHPRIFGATSIFAQCSEKEVPMLIFELSI